MAYFMEWGDSLYITRYPELDTDISSVGYGVIEETPHYIRVFPLVDGLKFKPTSQFVVYESKRMPSYCRLCINHIRNMVSCCSVCEFNPRHNHPFPFDTQSLIHLMRSRQLVETDRNQFDYHISNLKRNAQFH